MSDASIEKVAKALLLSSIQDKFGMAPFDPAVNTPRDIGLGGPSTEYLATSETPDGGAFNYPQIWWDKQGNPHHLQGDDAYDAAMTYEQATGDNFPRFDSIGQAVWHAMNRSALGGASKKRLTQSLKQDRKR